MREPEFIENIKICLINFFLILQTKHSINRYKKIKDTKIFFAIKCLFFICKWMIFFLKKKKMAKYWIKVVFDSAKKS